jgi:hypothetical protein
MASGSGIATGSARTTVMAQRAPVKSEQRGFNTRHEEAVMALSADRWLRPLSVHCEPANTEPEEYAHLL